MKTLNNHIILFDAECPMCSLYTKAFINTGMLAEDGRASYQHAPVDVCPLIDQQRAVNEIALIDTQTGEVEYGIKSLFKIIGHSLPILKPVFDWKPLIWLMSKVYAFVSYNRRVIIPVATDHHPVQPAFKLHYRLAYLLFTWLMTGLILTKYALLISGVVPLGNPYREFWICGGQIIFQGMIISTFSKEDLWAYLGNMMTISFAGSLLLLLPIMVSNALGIPVFYNIVYFMGVAGLMFLEHMRRCKLLGLGLVMSSTWVLYRLLLLLLIYKMN